MTTPERCQGQLRKSENNRFDQIRQKNYGAKKLFFAFLREKYLLKVCYFALKTYGTVKIRAF